MTKTFFLALILAIAGMGCTKTSNFGPANNLAESTNAKISTLSFHAKAIDDSAGNPSNPFDIYGQEHNRVLVLSENIWMDTSRTLPEIYNSITSIPVPSIPDEILDYAHFEDLFNSLMDDTATIYSNFIRRQGYSDKVVGYLSELLHWTDFVEKSETYEAYISSIINVEKEIQNDNGLSDSDRALLLKTASITRYSSSFWMEKLYSLIGQDANVAMRPSGPGKIWKGLVAFVKKNKGKILKVVGADLGGLTGGFSGAVGASAGALGSILLSDKDSDSD